MAAAGLATRCEEVFAVLEKLRGLPGVRAVESWTHLHAVKEENDLALPH